MSYWTYYLVWLLLAYGLRTPWLVLGVLLFLLLRRWIPDPSALYRSLGRLGALRRQVSVNAANVTARRDLALAYLDLLRPKAALSPLEQALAREPDNPELLYLWGLALHRSGEHERALDPLVRAVDLAPNLRYGEPYSVAGDALLALGRDEEALDAYERFAGINSSDVAVHTNMARAHGRRGDREGARESIRQAIRTFGQLHGATRRRALRP
jgi:tetratricopeptide (TPR) repeat protein